MNEDFKTVESWCDQKGDTFLVADPNGDHHDDWICHHSDGSVCTKYNSLIFGGKTIQYFTLFKDCKVKALIFSFISILVSLFVGLLVELK